MKLALDLVDTQKEEVLDVKHEVRTVADLKQLIHRQTGIIPQRQILIHKNTYLVNNRALWEFKVKMGHTVSLKVRPTIWEAFLQKNAVLTFLAGLFFGLGYYVSTLVVRRVLKDLVGFAKNK